MILATSRDLASAYGLAGPSALPAYRGLAQLVREHVARSAPLRQAVLTRRLMYLCKAAGFDESGSRERVKEVIEHLLELGDVVAVWIDGAPILSAREELNTDALETIPSAARVLSDGAYLVPGLLTLVKFEAAVLVSGSWIGGRATYDLQTDDDSLASTARWCSPESATTILEGHELSPSDWTGPTGWLGRYPVAELLHERLNEASGSQEDLRAQRERLWELILEDLRPERAGSDDGMKLIAGPPGRYFGKHQTMDGRWRLPKDSPDGTWLGVRVQGKRSKLERPAPIIAEVQGGEVVRSAKLRSWEEFRWGLLIKGELEGQPERLQVEGELLRQTCPLPGQLQRLLMLLPRVGSWEYQLRGDIGRSLVTLLELLGGMKG